MRNAKPLFYFALAVVAMLCPEVLADSMPWESPLNRLTDSLTGPVAKSVGLIAFAVTGLSLAMGEAGGVFKRMLQIVFGLSIAFSAATWGLGFIGAGA